MPDGHNKFHAHIGTSALALQVPIWHRAYMAPRTKSPCETDTALEKFKRDKVLTDEQLAEMFGLSREYVSRLRVGARFPSLEKAIEIAKKTDGAVPVEAWRQ